MRADNGDPQRVFGEMVAGNYFEALGVRPIARPRRSVPRKAPCQTATPVAVISHKFWQRRFDGDPSIVGRTITLNAIAFTVIGVAPDGFHGTRAVPQPRSVGSDDDAAGGHAAADRLHRARQPLARRRWFELKPGVSIARAQADLDVDRPATWLAAYAEDAGRGITLFELWRAPSMGGVAVTAVMGVQLGVAGVVLLIACANVGEPAAGKRGHAPARNGRPADARRQPRPPRAAAADGEQRCSPSPAASSALLFAYWTRGSRALFIPPAPLPIDINPRLNVEVMLFAAARHRCPPRCCSAWSRRCRARPSSLMTALEGVGDRGHRDTAARACAQGAGRRAGRAVAGAARVGGPVRAHAAERAVGGSRVLDAKRPGRRRRSAAGRLRRAARPRVLPRRARARPRDPGRRGGQPGRGACRSDSAAAATSARRSTATRRRRNEEIIALLQPRRAPTT